MYSILRIMLVAHDILYYFPILIITVIIFHSHFEQGDLCFNDTPCYNFRMTIFFIFDVMPLLAYNLWHFFYKA